MHHNNLQDAVGVFCVSGKRMYIYTCPAHKGMARKHKTHRQGEEGSLKTGEKYAVYLYNMFFLRSRVSVIKHQCSITEGQDPTKELAR